MLEMLLIALIGGFFGVLVATITSALDKSKILFEKKFEALSALHVINADLFPSVPEQIGLEWDEALETLVTEFPNTEKKLRQFRYEYAAALKEDELRLLDFSIQGITNGSFQEGIENRNASEQQKTFANEMYDDLKKLEKKLRDGITKQTEVFPMFYIKSIVNFLIRKLKIILRYCKRVWRRKKRS